MPAWVRLAGSWLRTFWWVIVLIVVGLLGGWWYLKRKKAPLGIEPASQPLIDAVTDKIQDSVTDAKVERAVIKTKSAIQRQRIEEIRKEPDGKKRREKLASILQKSI